MRTKVGNAVIMPMVLLGLLAACSEKQAEAPTQQPSAEQSGTQPAARKPLSMRTTDVRLKTGAAQNKSCNIETANGTLFWPEAPKATKTATIDVGGWIIDEESKSIPNNAKIRLQTANGISAWEQDIVNRGDRQDVAKQLGSPDYLKSGFKVSLDVADLAPGDYVVYLAFDTPEGEAVCGIGRRLTLVP